MYSRLLLGPRSERPASIYLGVMPLPLVRTDGAPWGPGLLASEYPEKRKDMTQIIANSVARSLMWMTLYLDSPAKLRNEDKDNTILFQMQWRR